MRSLPPLVIALALAACSPTEGTEVKNDSGSPDTSPDATEDTVVDDTMDAPGDLAETDTAGEATDASFTAPVLSKTGSAGKVLLRGRVVTPDTDFAGEVLVVGNLITCVDVSCSGTAGASEASVIETNGLIFPGLIDTHNHILFDVFDETHWSPTKAYDNHNQWPAEARYSAVVDAKQWLNGESTAYAPSTYGSLGCELEKYGELKGMVAGTTSIVGTAGTAKKCFSSLVRSIDTQYNGGLTTVDTIQVATLFPAAPTAQGICDKMLATPPTIDAYLIHVGEGVDSVARAEFTTLAARTTPAECLFAPQTTITHGTSFLDAELSKMGAQKMSLTWSPRSNVFLYGAGTDLTKTTNIPLALSKGIMVALSPDWSMGGSQNLLDELRFADKVDNGAWSDKLTPKMLVQMVTINAAKVLHREKYVGSLEVGKRADIMVISGDTTKPYDALLAANPRNVNMTMIDGVILYGDPALQPIAPATPGCETIDVCTAKKFLCVATATTTDKLNQTYADITAALTKGLADFDALASPVTTYKFSPITPLVRCP
jgi:cytosine/adenosine deaminase-related metal-dependent hydrolase